MDPEIGDGEDLANFIVESNKFASDGGVHFKAMLPDGSGERSLFRIDGLSREYIAAWGKAFVANPRDKPLYGWGKLKAASVTALTALFGITLKWDEPQPRHAVIADWPPEVEKRRAAAMELAKCAEACRWP